jgi:hypothetical protein
MNFLNLTPLEFGAILAGLSAVVTVLYLLDRQRRRLVVASLRFWQAALDQTQMERKRRISQPWSLLLQLLALLCLVAAIAQPRWGSLLGNPRHHVLILDASAVTAARSGETTLLALAQRDLLAALDRIPASDRVMLIRAEGAASTAVAFTDDVRRVQQAIRETQPGVTALRLKPAFALAGSAIASLKLRAGDIVYAGPARAADASEVDPPANLRILLTEAPVQNTGLRQVALQPAAEGGWRTSVTVANDADAARDVTVSVSLGQALLSQRRIAMRPRSEQQLLIPVATRKGGEVRVWISPADALPADDSAALELPVRPVRRLVVYSSRPETWRALLAAADDLQGTFADPSAYNANPDADAMVVDDFAPPVPPSKPALMLGAAARARSVVRNLTVTQWSASHPVTLGLQALRLPLSEAGILAAGRSTAILAESANGPVAVADESPRQVRLGFSLVSDALRAQVATPLLFSNSIEYLVPSRAESSETRVAAAGQVSLQLPTERASNLTLTTASGAALPFTFRRGRLDFFAGATGPVRIRSGSRESSLSLALPELTSIRWRPGPSVARGLPPPSAGLLTPRELWPWLVGLAVALLIADWFLFGSLNARVLRMPPVRHLIPFRRAS